jgi:hypothetical protein
MKNVVGEECQASSRTKNVSRTNAAQARATKNVIGSERPASSPTKNVVGVGSEFRLGAKELVGSERRASSRAIRRRRIRMPGFLAAEERHRSECRAFSPTKNVVGANARLSPVKKRRRIWRKRFAFASESLQVASDAARRREHPCSA